MKKIVIRTEREINKAVFYDIVYEWENELCKALKAPMFYAKKYYIGKREIGATLLYRLKINFEDFFLLGKVAFAFEMFGQYSRETIHSSHSAICIIDFYPHKDLLHAFYNTYRKVPYLCVSSREVYEYLMNHNPERTIYHLPLSIPDNYRITKNTRFKKKYDLILVGRQNERFEKWLTQYCQTHTIRYVYRKYINHETNEFLYYTNDGEFVCNVITREDYFKILKLCKLAIYTTPGIEGDPKKDVTNGFSQVTPRYLELLTCGCMLLGDYPDNPDTKYYELERFVSRVTSYKQFEETVNKLLKQEVNIEEYSNYLEKHYTSIRAKQFEEILNQK